MTFTRKEFLKLGLVGGAGLVLPSSASPAWGRANGTTGYLLRSKAQLPKPFMIPLHVPPVLEPVRTEEGIDFYEMIQKPGRAESCPASGQRSGATTGSSPAPPSSPAAVAK